MLTATLLALAAAVLHAGWNLAVKQSAHDRYVALWAQFLLGGVMAAIGFAISGGMPARGWMWAAASGIAHIPYLVLLARAYGHGDFSLVYPIARGGGALLAAIGGVALMGDHLGLGGFSAILLIAAGLALLAGRWRGHAALTASGVALSICAYTLLDSQGARSTDQLGYAFASSIMTAVTSTIYGVLTNRTAALRAAMRMDWRRFALAGFASLLTYTLVLIAVRFAPVGYVTALRESSVVLAAIAGWRFLGERDARRRIIASGVVLAGLVLLVTTAH